jgi:dTMP kinase
VLPPVAPPEEPRGTSDADKTAVLPSVPPVPGTARESDPADRVPPWLFRPETPENERTRELPSMQQQPARRPRPEWAEETPLDDLPTLADELLGRRDPEPGEPGEPRDKP